ncbi:GGDEF domain-containing protein [Marinobacterium sp. YM272]|uniref:GGDEF domain-containing protein n=1 Tax=Marinobacterium sp. YM272 TaxID=3421654 RepID=UPI003D7FFB1B
MVQGRFAGGALDSGQAEAELLTEIIREQRLYPVFQPIVDLSTGECFGHEALIRGPEGTSLYSPYHLFNAAIRNHLQHRLELLCRRCSVERYSALGLQGKLFLNVSASLLSTPEHQHGFTAELLGELGIPQENIVIELSEQHPFDHHGLTRSAVDHYREMGFHIAIDDLGSGYSGLKLWSELHPDYVKIDMHFVRGIERDSVKREFVRAICNIGDTLDCKIIAEGIETLEELHALQEMGVRYGQGFLLGRPAREPDLLIEPLVVRHGYLQSRSDCRMLAQADTARVLVRSVPAVVADAPLHEVSQIFSNDPQVISVPVLVNGEPAGVVRRADLLARFAAKYGRALYEQRPVSRLMQTDVLIVPADTPLEKVSLMVTGQEESLLIQQDLVIVEDGCYLGMGNVRDLLRRMTELKVRNARFANPLTLLPGSVPINSEVDRLLQRASDFHVAYIDLNHFKAFNDSYGYTRGDELIRELGELLVRFVSFDDNYLGHVSGDDFVVLFRHHDWRKTCESILAAFEERVQTFCHAADLEAGGIWAPDRHGQKAFYPLISLAIGVVHPDPYQCSSCHEVAELALEAKMQAKAKGGNALYLSPRRAPDLLPAGCRSA